MEGLNMNIKTEAELTVVVCGSEEYNDVCSATEEKQPHKSELFSDDPRSKSFIHMETTSRMWVTSVAKAIEEVREYECQTQSKYIMQRRRSYDIDKARIRWDCTDNFPFKIVRVHKMECQHAKDRNKLYNDKRRSNSLDNPKPGAKRKKYKRYISAHVSKKTDCPAYIEILEAEIYPQYQLPLDATVRQKKTASQVLRYDLGTKNEDVYKEMFCRITFPALNAHKGHGFGEIQPTRHQLDSRLVDKIEEMVANGVSSMREIKQTLTDLVQELFTGKELPCKSHRRFWPTRKVICHHYVNACIRQNKVQIDGDNITLAPGRWDKPSAKDSVFYYYFATAADKPPRKRRSEPATQVIEEVVTTDAPEEEAEVYQESTYGNGSELMHAYTNFYEDQSQVAAAQEDVHRKVASSITNSLEEIYKGEMSSDIEEVKQHLEYALHKLNQSTETVETPRPNRYSGGSESKRPRLSIILCQDDKPLEDMAHDVQPEEDFRETVSTRSAQKRNGNAS
uniref:Uncharacterized protein LOC104265996 n=1 Tax=Phallusia mammillata TaxID=59560 RepID=A0A6F9DJQ9_9ASCI|nr:uncharacterized protein LOC104265996 [Phallusia mammillata]